ncbi:stage II sporulation protein R [Geosporobacter ferrireducens]|uniref:Stage II sporulation protein R n=2 Tax=Geosporobacter ferrireducens TaxID=1424294 RepID=A0A1D8GQE2_9FIRM|nr:stage II sporulation protein R [Geosporobacter ferrireducens]
MIDMHQARQRCMIGIVFIAMVTTYFFSAAFEAKADKDSYKERLIRFHVLANSDSPEDQALKLKVRDRVIAEMNPKFEQSKSLDETRKILQASLENIETIAMEELQKNGSSDTVRAELGEVNFPTKNYGSITLPAGSYEALRIVIGRGQGANWWCVLFPPLCFVDMKSGLTNEKTKRELMSVLTEEEFRRISTASSEEAVPVKLKFKVAEIFESAKANIGRVVGLNE